MPRNALSSSRDFPTAHHAHLAAAHTNNVVVVCDQQLCLVCLTTQHPSIFPPRFLYRYLDRTMTLDLYLGPLPWPFAKLEVAGDLILRFGRRGISRAPIDTVVIPHKKQVLLKHFQRCQKPSSEDFRPLFRFHEYTSKDTRAHVGFLPMLALVFDELPRRPEGRENIFSNDTAGSVQVAPMVFNASGPRTGSSEISKKLRSPCPVACLPSRRLW